jgi:hypothetical protein
LADSVRSQGPLHMNGLTAAQTELPGTWWCRTRGTPPPAGPPPSSSSPTTAPATSGCRCWSWPPLTTPRRTSSNCSAAAGWAHVATARANRVGAGARAVLDWRRRSQPTSRLLPTLPRHPRGPGGRAPPTHGRRSQQPLEPKSASQAPGSSGIAAPGRVARKRRPLVTATPVSQAKVMRSVAGVRGAPVSDGHEVRTQQAHGGPGRRGERRRLDGIVVAPAAPRSTACPGNATSFRRRRRVFQFRGVGQLTEGR